MLLFLAALTTAAGGALFVRVLGADGWGPIDFLLLVLFLILYYWISVGFWTATLGLVSHLRKRERPPARGPEPPSNEGSLPATAIVMPIYNEDPRRVFANLRAICDSLRETGRAGAFDVFVLSDTRDPDIWIQEEIAWVRLRARTRSRIYYRRRPENVNRKSGNIQDFCERWGARYRYMVILDADSLMTGETIVEMVRRMEADPEVGILSVPAALVNRESFFARLMQFSSALYGTVFRCGFSLWAKSEGNYWGHNAILRIEPFMRYCGLPHLPGRPPWGGEILSHDFVEAAMMLSADWKVVVADDLGGSYEECPSNLLDFAKRDERWSMGNLQHLPITIGRGVHPVSRFHMAMGALTYLASPLWALFLVLSLLHGIAWQLAGGAAVAGNAVPAAVALAPLGGALALLLLVKVWALVAVLRRPSLAARFGRRTKLTASVLLETAVSFLVAPILMAFHTTFFVNSLLGRTVSWEAQPRDESAIPFGEAFRVHAPHTIAGLAAALLVSLVPGGLVWWTFPILLGLILSAPLSVLLSSVRIGRRLRTAGMLLIPEETECPPILKRQPLYLAEEVTSAAAVDPLTRLVVDPVVLRLHLDLLPNCANPPMSAATRDRLQRIVLSGGPSRVTRAERLLLLQDPQALRWLHREVWTDWPVKTLQEVAPGG